MPKPWDLYPLEDTITIPSGGGDVDIPLEELTPWLISSFLWLSIDSSGQNAQTASGSPAYVNLIWLAEGDVPIAGKTSRVEPFTRRYRLPDDAIALRLSGVTLTPALARFVTVWSSTPQE
jgi:hypothetical protein